MATLSAQDIVKSDLAESPQEQLLRSLLKLSNVPEIPIRAEIAGWLGELRQRSTYDAAHGYLPTRKDEEWQFTDLSGLLSLDFAAAPELPMVQPDAIAPHQIPEAQGATVVFVNGMYTPELSDLSALPEGVFVGNLATQPLDDNYDAVKFIAHHEGIPDTFTALNTAGFPDVAIIWVSADVVVETPIQLLWVTTAGTQPTFIQPRGLVICDRGSQLSLIEQYVSVGDQTPYFNNAVMEVFVQDNAKLTHTRLQQESTTAYHLATTMVRQAQDSTYTCNTLDFGAQLSRHVPSVWQKGTGTSTNLNGLTLINGKQVSDTHSLIALNHPHGTTDQLHKCVMDDAAQAVFSGKVLVPQAAQQTSAAQLNRNLLLSDKARINTQPQLQITADNVQCTHGATVSQMDADELFYLQSRGINADLAKVLLLRAFVSEVIDRVEIASVREKLTQAVANYTKVNR